MERFKLWDIDAEQFYMVPKVLFTNPFYKGLNANAKLIYAMLKDRMHLSRSNGWADENGDIYLMFKQDEIQDLMDISHATCVKAMKQLVEYELIDIVRQGLSKPNKVYIKKSKNYTSGSLKNRHQEVQKLNTNNTEYSKTEKNNTEKSRAGKPATAPKGGFKPPTLEEVQAYCTERGNLVDPQSFVDFYESKGWYVGKNKMKDWKAAVRTWERRDNNRPRYKTRDERLREDDARRERMCKEYDEQHSQSSFEDIKRLLSK